MHHFPVRIYYEDTDHSGRVYHANYLKYFERAREHVLGAEELVRLYRDQGYGFVVYKVELSYREGAIFGDELDIRSDVRRESDWRIRFLQSAWRPGGASAAVEGVVELVCVDRDHRLVKLPESIRARF